MKTILVAINAAFHHTGLAVRSIAAYLRAHGLSVETAEFTINQTWRQILRGLDQLDGDCYLFSCYLWNINVVTQAAEELRKIRPDAVLAAGGPEVSFHSDNFLRENPAFTAVLRGEGEETAREWLTLLAKVLPLKNCPGLTLRTETGIEKTPSRPPISLDALYFPYHDLEQLSHRTLYYESMRGCPFSCGFCLSSAEEGVRFRSLELVKEDLRRFLAAGVRQVKLVDRTFNCDKQRALALWRFLQAEDNGVTNFHFELSGDLLDQESLALLATVRPGLFQFEIGVQSTSTETLQAVRRSSCQDLLMQNAAVLRGQERIHLHLDLIAGLPFEDFTRFAQSFDEVYRMRPHQLQLGFLKVLKGSEMERRAEEWGIRYQRHAPYEVLCTRWLSFRELDELSGIAQMADLYYNSGRFAYILDWLCGHFTSPFSLYRALWKQYLAEGCDSSTLSKIGHYDLLGSLMRSHGIPVTDQAQWLCKYDLLLHEKPRKLPNWIQADRTAGRREEILRFLDQPDVRKTALALYKNQNAKQVLKAIHVELFPFHPQTGEAHPVFALFDYQKRSLTGRAAVSFFPCP